MQVMSELVNKTIKEVYAQLPQGHFIKLVDQDQQVYYYALEGDCCSESWLYAINNIEALLNQEILTVENVEMSNQDNIQDGKSRQEYDQLYCIKLTTSRGNCDIEFRNSSNGYYGGSIESEREDQVYEHDYANSGTKRLEVEWTKITKSFTN